MDNQEMYSPIFIQKIIESEKNQINLLEILQKINKSFLKDNIKNCIDQSFLQNEIQLLYKDVHKAISLGNVIYMINIKIIEFCLQDLKKTLLNINLQNLEADIKEVEEIDEEEDLDFISETQKRREIMSHEDRLDLGHFLIQQKENAEANKNFLDNTDSFLQEEEKQTPRQLWRQ